MSRFHIPCMTLPIAALASLRRKALPIVLSFAVRPRKRSSSWRQVSWNSGGKAGSGLRAGPDEWGLAKRPDAARNTTIACVATDAALTPAQARRFAVMAQDGLSRAIRPAHAPFDGDIVFALSTGQRPLEAPADFVVARLGALAADALARAIARGVHEATAWPGTDVRCWLDLPR